MKLTELDSELEKTNSPVLEDARSVAFVRGAVSLEVGTAP
jgi:hypothetical protein